MLGYDKKFIVSLCEKYISKAEQIVYKSDSAENKYKKLLLLKYKFESSKIYNKLPYDYEKFISFFIDWNLKIHEKLIDNNKITIKNNLANLFKNLFNMKMR